MSLVSWAQVDSFSALASPLSGALLLLAVGLWSWVARPARWLHRGCTWLALVGLVSLALILPSWGNAAERIIFWCLAATAVVAAAAAVAARNPVYTAIWFALSLLGVAGIFLLQQAYFLGVATIVVYAGAIVVTFLFVLMLAQPRGRAIYDRISWSWFPAPLAIAASIGLILSVALAADWSQVEALPGDPSVVGDAHMARVGAELFARHLIAVEVAGTLLLVALVGAIAIVMHGQPRRSAQPPQGRVSEPTAPGGDS